MLVIIGLLAILFSSSVYANKGSIAFKNFELKARSEHRYVIDTQLRFQLSDYLRNSLREGVPIVSEIQINLVKNRLWWWDKNKNLATITSLLKYHPLSQHYQVIQQDSNESWNFKSLNMALSKMGLLRNYVLPQLSDATQGGKYRISLYVSLRPDTFKFPMKVHALFVNKYKIETTGVQWPLP
jgi:hypothetical protein